MRRRRRRSRARWTRRLSRARWTRRLRERRRSRRRSSPSPRSARGSTAHRSRRSASATTSSFEARHPERPRRSFAAPCDAREGRFGTRADPRIRGSRIRLARRTRRRGARFRGRHLEATRLFRLHSRRRSNAFLGASTSISTRPPPRRVRRVPRSPPRSAANRSTLSSRFRDATATNPARSPARVASSPPSRRARGERDSRTSPCSPRRA